MKRFVASLVPRDFFRPGAVALTPQEDSEPCFFTLGFVIESPPNGTDFVPAI